MSAATKLTPALRHQLVSGVVNVGMELSQKSASFSPDQQEITASVMPDEHELTHNKTAALARIMAMNDLIFAAPA